MSSYLPSTTSHGTLLSLRITCFALAIVAVIVFSLGDTDYIAIGVTGGSALWSLIHLVFLQIRKPPHPGLLVAFDLIAAGINIVFGVLALVGIAYLASSTDNILSSAALTIAGPAIQVVAGIAHFIVFIFACWDVHVRRRSPSYSFADTEK